MYAKPLLPQETHTAPQLPDPCLHRNPSDDPNASPQLRSFITLSSPFSLPPAVPATASRGEDRSASNAKHSGGGYHDGKNSVVEPIRITSLLYSDGRSCHGTSPPGSLSFDRAGAHPYDLKELEEQLLFAHRTPAHQPSISLPQAHNTCSTGVGEATRHPQEQPLKKPTSSKPSHLERNDGRGKVEKSTQSRRYSQFAAASPCAAENQTGYEAALASYQGSILAQARRARDAAEREKKTKAHRRQEMFRCYRGPHGVPAAAGPRLNVTPPRAAGGATSSPLAKERARRDNSPVFTGATSPLAMSPLVKIPLHAVQTSSSPPLRARSSSADRHRHPPPQRQQRMKENDAATWTSICCCEGGETGAVDATTYSGVARSSRSGKAYTIQIITKPVNETRDDGAAHEEGVVIANDFPEGVLGGSSDAIALGAVPSSLLFRQLPEHARSLGRPRNIHSMLCSSSSISSSFTPPASSSVTRRPLRARTAPAPSTAAAKARVHKEKTLRTAAVPTSAQEKLVQSMLLVCPSQYPALRSSKELLMELAGYFPTFRRCLSPPRELSIRRGSAVEVGRVAPSRDPAKLTRLLSQCEHCRSLTTSSPANSVNDTLPPPRRSKTVTFSFAPDVSAAALSYDEEAAASVRNLSASALAGSGGAKSESTRVLTSLLCDTARVPLGTHAQRQKAPPKAGSFVQSPESLFASLTTPDERSRELSSMLNNRYDGISKSDGHHRGIVSYDALENSPLEKLRRALKVVSGRPPTRGAALHEKLDRYFHDRATQEEAAKATNEGRVIGGDEQSNKASSLPLSSMSGKEDEALLPSSARAVQEAFGELLEHCCRLVTPRPLVASSCGAAAVDSMDISSGGNHNGVTPTPPHRHFSDTRHDIYQTPKYCYKINSSSSHVADAAHDTFLAQAVRQLGGLNSEQLRAWLDALEERESDRGLGCGGESAGSMTSWARESLASSSGMGSATQERDAAGAATAIRTQSDLPAQKRLFW